MKIVVTPQGKKKEKLYIVQVVDGDSVIHSEEVKGLQQRDTIVWKLADLYNVMEIEITDTKTQDTFKFSSIPSIPVLEEEEAETFFEENQQFTYDRILQAVQEGVLSGRDSIRLFELSGTGVYMTSNKKDWNSGVQQALQYYEQQEQYDKCETAKHLLEKL